MFRSPVTGRVISPGTARNYYQRIIHQLETDPSLSSVTVGRSEVSSAAAIDWITSTVPLLFPREGEEQAPEQEPGTETTTEETAPEAPEEPALPICEQCRNSATRLHDVISEYTQSVVTVMCVECIALTEHIIGFNYIIGKYQLRFLDTTTAVTIEDPITYDRTVVSPQFFRSMQSTIQNINDSRPRDQQLIIINSPAPEGEETENQMPQYNTMPETGSCMYLCGRQAEKPSMEPGACNKCAPIVWCDECISMGRPHCPRCLKKEVARIEEEETTLRVQRVYPNNYHSPKHSRFKARKFRLKGERPYLYYGVEIEVELPSNVDRQRFAEHICLAAKGIFVAERDASLRNGVEFISRPMSYLAWTSQEVQEILKEVFNQFNLFGVYTVSQKSSGMHVHMSKMFFQKSKKKTVQQQKEDIAWIFEFYDREIATLSRRSLNQYCRSRRMVTENEMRNMRIMSKKYSILIEKEGPVVSRGSGDTHHHMLSETSQTLEVRTFSTPRTLLHVMAAIEICRNLAHYARNYPLKDVNLGQIMHSKSSPALDEYAKEIGFDPYNTPTIKDHIKVSKDRVDYDEIPDEAYEDEEDY